MDSVIQKATRIIIKVGSSLVTNDGRGLDHAAIVRWAAQISGLRALGKEVVLVSSGAIAEGMLRLGFEQRPTDIHELQACAAVGQMGLAQIYESSFRAHSLGTAQVLLTHADLADRERYLNARSTLTTLLLKATRIIIKVGSSLVTNDGRGLDHAAIARWAAQISGLRALGKEVVLVSSGAIAEGMLRLGFEQRPTDIHELQACAAVGQMGLAQIYESSFRAHSLGTAQVLLTHADLADRERYLNARSTLTTLLRLGVVPIINENDTVVTDEIKFGDNDTLGALVANLDRSRCAGHPDGPARPVLG